VDDTTQERLDTLEKVVAWLRARQPYSQDWSTFPIWLKNAGEDEWWKWREAIRSEDRVTPNWIPEIKDVKPNIHNFYVFLSRKDPLRIAYTPTPADGRRDRQVMTTVGRFLTKHYSEVLSEEMIRRIADLHRASYGEGIVYFAFDANDIAEGYHQGPHSCMKSREWGINNHPVRVYDGPDTALAYIKNPDDRISARTVIRLDRTPMVYTRIYGDETVLKSRLGLLGFNGPEDLEGVRLRLEENRSGHTCPFIDGVSEAEERDGFLVLGEGDANCQRTNGICSDRNEDDDRECCEGCEDYFDTDDLCATYQDGHRCDSCIDNYYYLAVVNECHEEYYVLCDDTVEINGRVYINNPSLLNKLHFVYSEEHADWYHIDDVTKVDDDWYENDLVCFCHDTLDAALRENCFQDHNLNWYLKTDCVEVNGVMFHPDNPPDDVELVNGE
jgi:hypothetical protein